MQTQSDSQKPLDSHKPPLLQPPVLQHQVVVFSKNYLPLARINIKRAIVLLVTGQAEALEFSSTQQWEVRSASLVLQVSEHIRLKSGNAEQHWKVPPVSRREVLRRDNHACQYCGSPKHLTLDHVIPRSKGGSHTWDNVVAACELVSDVSTERFGGLRRSPLLVGTPIASKMKLERCSMSHFCTNEGETMPFSAYKNFGSVLKEFQITYAEAPFMGAVAFQVSDYFREDLQTVMREGVVDNSEYAICENLVYPILKEVWKLYSHRFTLWSHQSLTCTDDLTGFPEYILAKRSPLGKVVFDQPYLLLVEAKQDKFDEGWAQCLAEMVAAQRLNQAPLTVFGIVSNGSTWQFGKLTTDTFTKHLPPYSIYELDELFSAVAYVFQECDLALESLVTA